MNKKSLGWFTLKWSIFGQLFMIAVGALSVIFTEYEAKPVTIYLTIVSIFYWAIFGTLTYSFRNWVEVEKESK